MKLNVLMNHLTKMSPLDWAKAAALGMYIVTPGPATAGEPKKIPIKDNFITETSNLDFDAYAKQTLSGMCGTSGYYHLYNPRSRHYAFMIVQKECGGRPAPESFAVMTLPSKTNALSEEARAHFDRIQNFANHMRESMMPTTMVVRLTSDIDTLKKAPNWIKDEANKLDCVFTSSSAPTAKATGICTSPQKAAEMMAFQVTPNVTLVAPVPAVR